MVRNQDLIPFRSILKLGAMSLVIGAMLALGGEYLRSIGSGDAAAVLELPGIVATGIVVIKPGSEKTLANYGSVIVAISAIAWAIPVFCVVLASRFTFLAWRRSARRSGD